MSETDKKGSGRPWLKAEEGESRHAEDCKEVERSSFARSKAGTQLPRRTELLASNAEPMRQVSETKGGRSGRAALEGGVTKPNLAKALGNAERPRFKRSGASKDGPVQARLCTNKEGPKCRGSEADRKEPMQEKPKAKATDPVRIMPWRDGREPSFTRSRAGEGGPDLASPSNSVILPGRPRL